MALYAAVMTGKGAGAIATVEVFGGDAEGVLGKVFKPAGSKPAEFKIGNILVGNIVDGEETIDQVTIGCEGGRNFAIHCHGNPLIVEMIMELLGSHGADLINADELLTRIHIEKGTGNRIAIEAKLAQLSAKTLVGTKIIANQVHEGLDGKASQWLADMETVSLGQIAAEAEQILADSRAAKLIIAGCTIVLAGAPNSGKSTLLNRLAGRQKAIVTDIEGTTRDWVSAECQIGPVCVKVIDTAGLDGTLAAGCDSAVDKAAQERAAQILGEAELVLLILDGNRPAEQIGETLLRNIAGKNVLPVLNKADLAQKLDTADLPKSLCDTVQISAELGTGIDALRERILQITGVMGFDPKTTVTFTPRQEGLIRQLATAKSKQEAGSIISELLYPSG